MNHHDYLDAGFKMFPLHSMHALPNGTYACGCVTEEQSMRGMKFNPDCEAVGKHPRSKNWQLGIPYSDEQIEVMENIGALDTGFGVLCEGYLIIDIDPRNGGDEGYERLCKDTDTDFKKESNFVVATGGGGWHIYFKAPSDTKLVKSVKQYPGIDFKSSGFVVGCGSMHKSGMTYENEKGHPCDIGDAPQKLINLLEQKQYERTSTDLEFDEHEHDIQALLDAIPNDDADYEDWINIGMAIHEATDGEGFDLWEAWSKKSTKHDPKQMQFKWHSFGKYNGEPITIGTLIKIAEDNGYVEPVTFEPTISSDVEVYSGVSSLISEAENFDITNPPGVCGELAAWIDAKSRCERRKISASLAVSVIGTLASLYWETKEGLGNSFCLYTVGIAGSGSGKDDPLKAMEEAYIDLGYGKLVSGKIKSGQEISRSILDSQLTAFSIDEIGLFLKSCIDERAPAYLQNVNSMLLNGYGKGTRTKNMLSRDQRQEVVNACYKEISRIQKLIDENEAKDFHHEQLDQITRILDDAQNGGFMLGMATSMAGVTVQSRLDECINSGNIMDGLLARFILVKENYDNPMQREDDEMVFGGLPDPLKLKIIGIMSTGETWNDHQYRFEYNGRRNILKFSDDARDLLKEIKLYYHELAEEAMNETGLTPLYRRCHYMVQTVASVLAIGDGGIVKREHVTWAIGYVNMDLRTKIAIANVTMASERKDSSEMALYKVQQYMSKDQGVTVNSIYKSNRSLKKEHIQKVFDHLIANGVAEQRVIGGKGSGIKGRPTQQYFLK